ncbi:HesA/MoeB/ThiF family protein [Acinetobacter sp. MD2(2019)]|uniref:HesA/MoeB/ThiF family protein n=1 Tax=Acinetobacter sp. MD2(2019) TaxID=2605273 RepID=UPI002D1F7C3E|nr:HesA/MoeB/ThiF family protein [Acinetobacter sp. MD2(2019)]MEB3754761.1 HesA/MoeB/ThiF family protein [Acinetobacter sp. MD2(2019)]
MAYGQLTNDEMLFYSRQILLPEWDIEAQEKLKLSNVLLVGAGGLGCLSAELLVRAGVGKLTILDADHIEVSNLQRQIAYTADDIGLFKAETLVKRLRKINPYIQVEYVNQRLTQANAAEWIQAQDLVLDGCDQFETRYLINAVCCEFEVPLLSASAIGLEGQLFMVMPGSACYCCLFPKVEQDDEQLRCANSGVLATTPNILASLQAHHALLYLGLNQTPLKQKLLLWNGKTMQQRILSFEKDPYCLHCRCE